MKVMYLNIKGLYAIVLIVRSFKIDYMKMIILYDEIYITNNIFDCLLLQRNDLYDNRIMVAVVYLVMLVLLALAS